MIAAICMMAAVFVFLYLYFREQNKIMEDAISRIRDYISGDRDVRLECNEEGELYRLFNLIPELTVEQNIIFPVLLEYQKPNKKYLEELLEVLGLKKTPEPSAQPAVRRAAAEGGHRKSPDHPPGPDFGGRTYRKPGYPEHQRGDRTAERSFQKV